jgi:Ca-activated chloride channel family protein
MAVWLLAIPAAVVFWLLHYRYKWRQRRPHLMGSRRHSRRTTAVRDVAVLGLSVLAVTLLIAAMMRPQVRLKRQRPVFDQRDLVLVLDRSISMRARDVFPSRFEHAIEEIQTFLRRKPEVIDRVALVGFAATSVILSYPTDDIESLSFYLDWVRNDPTPLFGTDIGTALESALSVVGRDPQGVPPVFVVISDGDDQGPELERAMARITRAGIRVNCVGIGSDTAVPMPVPDKSGHQGVLRDSSGGVLLTRLDEATLRYLASTTGGLYFRSVTAGELLSALDRIAFDERRQLGSTTTLEYRDVYLSLLAMGALVSLWLAALL